MARIYDWLNDPQRNSKIVGARANAELDSIDSAIATNTAAIATNTAAIAALRTQATGTVTYYVRKDGSDANTGLADTAGGAKLTIQAAVNAIAAGTDLRGQTGVVQVRVGTYNENVQLLQLIGAPNAGLVYLRGDTTTPSNVIIDSTIASVYGIGYMPEWYVEGFKFTSSKYGVQGHAGCWIRMGKNEFGACTEAHVIADHRGIVEFMEDYSVTGASTFHALAIDNSYVLNLGRLCTITGTPAFSGSFAAALTLSYLRWSGGTFSGSATGTRYFSHENSVINTGGGGANFFPGDVAGSTATGGQYV